MRGIVALALCAMILGATAAPHKAKYYAKSIKETRATWDEYVSFTAAMLQFIAMNGDMFAGTPNAEETTAAVRAMMTQKLANSNLRGNWVDYVNFVSQILEYVADASGIFTGNSDATDAGETNGAANLEEAAAAAAAAAEAAAAAAAAEAEAAAAAAQAEAEAAQAAAEADAEAAQTAAEAAAEAAQAEADAAQAAAEAEAEAAAAAAEAEAAAAATEAAAANEAENGADEQTEAAADAFQAILASRGTALNINARGTWEDYVMFIAGLMNVVATNSDIFTSGGSDTGATEEAAASEALGKMLRKAQVMNIDARGEWNDYVTFASQLLAYIAQSSDMFTNTDDTVVDPAIPANLAKMADFNMNARGGDWTDYVMFFAGLMDLVSQNADIFSPGDTVEDPAPAVPSS